MKISRVSVLALLFMTTFTENVEAISVRDKILSLQSKKAHGDGPSGENLNPEGDKKEEKDEKMSDDKKESHEDEMKEMKYDSKDSKAKKSADETAAATMKNAAAATMKDAAAASMKDAAATTMKDEAAATMKDAAAKTMKDAAATTMKDAAAKTMKDAAATTMKDAAAATMKDAAAKTMKDAKKAEESQGPKLDKNGPEKQSKDASGNFSKDDGLDKHGKDAAGNLPNGSDKHAPVPEKVPHFEVKATNSTGDAQQLQQFLSKELHEFSADQYSMLKNSIEEQNQVMKEALLSEKEDFKKALEDQFHVLINEITRKIYPQIDDRRFKAQHEAKMSLLNNIKDRQYEVHSEFGTRK